MPVTVDIGRGLERRAAPLHGSADLGQLQQRVIVFGVADRHGVPRRQAEHVERGVQPGGLADALRQRHHAAAVEQQHERQFQRANRLQQARRLVGGAVDQALARRDA